MSARRLLVLRHGSSDRLQGVAIVAGYEPSVQRSDYGRRDSRFDFGRRDPRFCRTPLRRSLALACLVNPRTLFGTRIETALILRTRTLSDMGALDKCLYNSHHTPTALSDCVKRSLKLARTGCMSSSAVRLSLTNCTYQLHPCTVLTAAHHKHVCSQHSASQDTLRDSTKCRGILACARFTALSHTESDEASSRSCCAQLTI